MATEPPLIVIVGPTASGKTALAMEVAQRVNGEIICADSRTIVRDIDVGSAKPTSAEQQQAQHWGLDLVDPTQQYTAAAFQQYATETIADIRRRGKVPLLAGGTGLYVDAVVFSYEFPAPMTIEQRQQLQGMTQEQLYEYCVKNNVELPINDKNKRHLIRSIAHSGHNDAKRSAPIPNTHVFGIVVNKTTLVSRIAGRAQHMIRDGIISEAQTIDRTYGAAARETFDSVYPGMRAFFDGAISEQELLEKIEYRDQQLAKRQMTWFRRNPFIQWGEHSDILERTSDLFTGE